MKILLTTVCVVAGLSCALHAQGATIHAVWDPNPATDNVIQYNLTVDALPAVAVPPTTDPTCSCVKAAITVAPGAHTVKVTAVNLMLSTDPTSTQESAPITVTFTLNPGAQLKNVKVTK